MALGIDYTTLLWDHMKARLLLIDGTAGAWNFNVAAKGVFEEYLSGEQVGPEKTPYVALFPAESHFEAEVSAQKRGETSLSLYLCVAKDEARWPGMSAARLLNMLIVDCHKAMEGSPAVGGGLSNTLVGGRTVRDIDGQFGRWARSETIWTHRTHGVLGI